MRSLFLKISFSVGLVVTVTLALFAYFLIENQKKYLLVAKNEEVEILSTLVRNGITNFMKEGRTKDYHNFLNLFAIQEDRLELRILDSDGKILHSSKKNEEGGSLTALFGSQTLSTKIPLFLRKEMAGRPFWVSLQPLPNEPSCFSCHGQEKEILGILNVSLPMEGTQRSLTFNRNLLVASTAITILLMVMAINFLLTRLVKKPTTRLMATISEVEKGDLTVKVDLGTQDELGRLAKNFSSMIQKLAEARRELERQHQQQMLQIRHLASLGELAASVAHEIKNPLAGIKLAIQVLAKEPGLPPNYKGTIQEIMQAIERLDKTMGDLLFYSRIPPPELRVANLPDVIEGAFGSLKEQVQMAGIKVEQSFDPSIPSLLLDSQQMERAFLNLFLNALQAMPAGGALSIQTRWAGVNKDPSLGGPTADGPPQGNWVEVVVQDNGEGIPREILGEVFRPFFTTKAKGTGLGLALAQQIIEQHQGKIFVESQLGIGTTFHLLLPLPPATSKGDLIERKDSHRR